MSYASQFELSKLNAFNDHQQHIPYPPTNQTGLNNMVVDNESIIIRNSYIVVSSLDRDWYSNSNGVETAYSFSVKLGGSGDTWQNYPLFQNNPTIPATQQQSLSGERGAHNISGWYSSTGIFYPAYDPSQPLGAQVDSETIVFKGDRFMVVGHEPHNIISIGVFKLLFSARSLDVGYSSTTASPENIPYLMVNVNNIDYVQYGTNKLIDNSIGLMVPYIPIPLSFANNYFVEYRNMLGNSKDFYNNPIANISRMTINIANINGFPVNPILGDVLEVYSIYYKITTPMDYSTEYLVVQTSTYFSSLQYKPGDNLLFKNYVYRDTGIYSECDTFNTFINHPNGHTIVAIDKTDPTTYLNNIIIICAPSIISTVTGNVQNLQWYSDLKMKTMGTIPVADNSGKLINCALQTQIAFNIKYLEKSTNFMSELL
jgi:hypothetical protein